ncbi:MAG: ABC transporter ATP-binding protein [Clostridiales bacterium]|nr:ABC transporter ATP-binding protein [Clostridiales bacterium]
MARNKFDIDEELEEEFNFQSFKRLLGYVKPYKRQVYFTIFLMLSSSIANLAGPYLLKIALDNSIPNKDIKGIIELSGIFLLTLLISAVCLKYKIRIMSVMGQNVIYNIRKDLFVHLQELPFTYYDSRPHGKILVRVVNYVNSLSDLLSNGIINFITDISSLVFIIVFMMLINVKLTLICMVGIPALVGAVFLIKNAQRKAWQVVSSKQSNLNAYIHESISGMKVTQSFVREKENLKIFGTQSDSCRKSWMKAVKIQFLMGPSVDNISILTISLVYLFGVSWIGKGVTVGVLIAFVGYIWRFWAPINNIANFYNQIINAMAYVERIFEAMDEKVTIKDLPGAVEMPPIKGDLEFRHVNFSYDEGRQILYDINFKVRRGETIALVGATGAGKTTIISLISRFYDVKDGNILIDGTDIKDVTLKSLRSQMGIMLQDSFVFSGTIMDNIRYGKLDASDEEVIAAAKAVKAHDFIMEMENGYMTQVNERGTRLSVGQRQLISFARALLADPRILILDEATSSIDTKTEMALQEGLQRLLRGRTSFIVAHRLSTIRNADRIMYIDYGRIVEEGTHDELMKKKGAYWKLYSEQYNLLEAI